MKIEIKIKSEDGRIDYVAVAFYALRRLPPELRAMLKWRGDWEDIVARCYLAAVEAWRLRLDFRASYNLAQREVYGELRALGFARVDNIYTAREVPARYVRGSARGMMEP